MATVPIDDEVTSFEVSGVARARRGVERDVARSRGSVGTIGFDYMRKSSAVPDVLAILVFVAVGRRVHDHGVSLRGLASTAWPFLVGLGVGWFALIRQRRSVTTLSGGVVVWLSTVVLGMILRVIAGQGIAFAFVLVALAFLGLFMLGWRAVFAFVRRLRAR